MTGNECEIKTEQKLNINYFKQNTSTWSSDKEVTSTYQQSYNLCGAKHRMAHQKYIATLADSNVWKGWHCIEQTFLNICH